MQAFWLSMGMIFAAEMGDKTQLVALCLATRYRAKVVLAGIFTATLLVHVVSVALGGGLGKLLPEAWIKLMAGMAFIGFGLWTLRGDSMDDEECQRLQGRNPFMLVATTFFLSELGDKTMLGTVFLASRYPVVPVWLGSTLGMVISDGLAILVGQFLGKKLPERAIKLAASCIFFGFGVFGMAEGAMKLPAYSWAISLAVVGTMVSLYLYQARKEGRAARMIDAAAEPVPVPEE